jgi:ubiquinone/menaquinone biosynthesis C-methylase UbiE
VRAGKDPERLDAADLIPVDQFHTRGVMATEELAAFAAIRDGETVLDLGCGLGGPARWIASRHRVTVTGVDLSADLCRTATVLTQRCGLADRARFIEGDATALPFPDRSFDLVWTQHVAANIPDRVKFYREAARVLKRGGRFVMHDIFEGPGGEMLLPVPWANTPGLSFLVRAKVADGMLRDVGFETREWRDVTPQTKTWLAELANRPPPAPGALTAALVLGPDFSLKVATMRRNFMEDRIEAHMARCRLAA